MKILMRHGAPRVLISDGGKEFNNSVLKAICKLLKIRKITTSPYNPRADGLAENQVKTCKDMLSSYCNAFQDDWDEYLAVVAHYYRTTYNDAIKMTPYRALYGRECSQINTMWIADVLESSVDVGLSEYVENLAIVMLSVWESLGLTVYENGLLMQQKLAKKASGRPLHQYSVGDWVLARNIPKSVFVSEVKVDSKRQKAKIRAALQNRWVGPYRIVRVISELTVVCIIKGREQKMAYKNIKPYVSADNIRKVVVNMME